MKYKSYKFRIYPNANQQVYLAKAFGSKRWIYNHFLSENQRRFEANEKHLNHFGCNLAITDLKKQDETCWLKEIDDWVLKNAAADLATAYHNFFESIKGKRKGQGTKTPRFKSKLAKQSFRTTGKIDVNDSTIKIPKLKEPIKVVLHRQIPENAEVKSATISKTKSNKFFVSVLVEEDEELKPMTGKEIGIDIGLKDLAIMSNGQRFANRFDDLTKAKQIIRREQRKLSKKSKGSNNWEKQRVKLAKAHERVNNIQSHYFHELSHYLVSNFDAIYTEDLNVSGMIKNRKLSRAIHETAWSRFLGMVEYKCSWYGKTFHQVDRFFPSTKTCSNCDHKLESLPLSKRSWQCPGCSVQHDRDVNAANNIKKQGQVDLYGRKLTSREETARINVCGEPSIGDCPSGLSRYGSLNQKAQTALAVG